MSNDSTTPGYLTPTGAAPLYDEALERELSRWVRAITALPAGMVRPRWTPEQAAQPAASVNVADQCKADWMFVDGKQEMIAKGEVVHDAIKLNSETGMIGMPQQTIGSGVNVRCLINPNIRINGLIELDQGSVYRTALGNNDIAMTRGRITDQNNNGNITVDGTTAQPASIATDGVYKVIGIMYTGDTRGQVWYMDMMCEARGSTDIYSQGALNRG